MILNEDTNHVLPKPDLIIVENPPHVNLRDMVYLKTKLEDTYNRKPTSKLERSISGHTMYPHCRKARKILFMGAYI